MSPLSFQLEASWPPPNTDTDKTLCCHLSAFPKMAQTMIWGNNILVYFLSEKLCGFQGSKYLVAHDVISVRKKVKDASEEPALLDIFMYSYWKKIQCFIWFNRLCSGMPSFLRCAVCI